MTFFTKKIIPTLTALLIIGVSGLLGQVPFWTEEFDGGLPADWAAVEVAGDSSATSNWAHTTTGPAGQFSIGPILSTSGANGWMLFDSDVNCSGEQDVWLVSPQLNLMDKSTVILRFETFYRRFNDLTWIEVSTDSTNWTPIEVFAGLENNDFGDGTPTGDANPQIMTVDLTAEAANQPSFWFAFHFLADQTTIQQGDPGCAYSWQVDDVRLFEEDLTPDIDLRLGDFFYPPRSFAQPITQIDFDTMAFSADISNIGNNAVTNIVLKAEVRNNQNAVIWDDSLIIPSLDPGVMDSTFQTPNLYVPEGLSVATHQIRYFLYSLDGDDGDMSNNSAMENFLVTDNLYSKENQATIGFRLNDMGEWAPANLYETSPNLVDDYMATDVTWFAFKGQGTGPLTDHAVTIVLLEIKDDLVSPNWDTFDPDVADIFQHPQMKLRSVMPFTYTTTGTSSTETITLEDFDLETPGVALKPGGRYILAAHYQQADAEIFHGFSQEINYFQLSTFVWTAGDATWFLGGFGPDAAATLRMAIELVSTTDDMPLPEGAMTVFPNPASDVLNVDVNLEKPSVSNITIADLSGRVLRLYEYENLHKETMQFNLSPFASGTYLVRIATQDGTKTTKFVVQH